MLRSRIIPCLLIHENGLVKSVKFSNYKYVGDPINAVKIFNEKEVDELIVLDIDASAKGKKPNFDLIRKIASECRMPLCYGGGVKTVDEAVSIVNLGAEKVALSSSVLNDFNLLVDIGNAIGKQSVVVVLDVKKTSSFFGKTTYEVYTLNGKSKYKYNLKECLEFINRIGIGELVINSIDNDGVMTGYDHTLVKFVRENTDYPVTVLGGAGELDHIRKLFEDFGTIGASAGSLFVFRGKYKAVLINYPSFIERYDLYFE
jgi:cyclase